MTIARSGDLTGSPVDDLVRTGTRRSYESWIVNLLVLVSQVGDRYHRQYRPPAVSGGLNALSLTRTGHSFLFELILRRSEPAEP